MDIQAIKNRFNIIGNSPKLIYALQTAVDVANTDLSVLIVGESGVGKENFSHIIHTLSSRKHSPFIAINCGAIPDGTIDSELFGHEKGAFTGAVESRKGYFETVNGGTLFLDEIGEMPLGTQSRLLRILESGEFIKVGSSKVLKTDVRIIAATNKDLYELTMQNKFREDLFYRLNTVPIKVPPLRERKEDIILLFRKFASDFAEKYKRSAVQLSNDAKEIIMNYYWKGNIRELKNFAEQLSVLSKQPNLTAADIEFYIPAIQNRHSNLPVLVSNVHEPSNFNNERDILYKLFFDMKTDVTELKKMFLEILKNPNIANHNFNHSNLNAEIFSKNLLNKEDDYSLTVNHKNKNTTLNEDDENIDTIDVDEPLNLSNKEMEFINRALIKYNGKRNKAAKELGISERTLYRKIKEYNLE